MFVSSVYVSGERGLFSLLSYYIAAMLRVFVEFGDTVRSAGLIDTGIEINIITLDLARCVGFSIRDGFRFINMIFQTGHARGFYGVVEEMSVKMGSAVN